ncbi:MAG: asparaginase [Gammaproteobacteria bacterium]|nr:asparaginase [Gammaproteobacteria bacterium]
MNTQNTESLNPVMAEVFRENTLESWHRGAAVVVDSLGQTVLAFGDVERIIFPRSAIKMFQAIPLLESGAAEHFSLTAREIALACASHNGEPEHVLAVQDWLSSLGLSADDLENGPSRPYSAKAFHELLKAGEKSTRAHHNCSGKHAGMLTMARYLGLDVHGYTHPEHGAQQVWMEVMSDFAGLDVTTMDCGKDGCGAPAITMPLIALARACARYSDQSQLPKGRAQAVQKIITSISEHPWMIAGTGRCCTDVIDLTKGRVLVKTGAEAAYCGFIPDRNLGLALKIDDGSTRASQVALGQLLLKVGAISDDEYQFLGNYFKPAVVNSNKDRTGYIVPSGIWNE